ncbi:uncharacterized protein VP01_2114g3 [Puccinia sorghi]|uniref:Restriction of telomere capping protein 4 C-terminal domain-containing protein n=1 Tax=Puccinia sorghi TaxID=27349 RepID=A0A0L6VAM6_9BASI|nr:uncharacterized protein VP01_2114g3 [Puccinia sorghi]
METQMIPFTYCQVTSQTYHPWSDQPNVEVFCMNLDLFDRRNPDIHYQGKVLHHTHWHRSNFLQKVLVPEATLGLIAEDLQLDKNNPDVMKKLVESQAYGEAMFPDDE